ncbi:DUF3231 family protein [Paenibacillus sp. BSR1-1]|uniref:DUF3231 family protein n=1 Tax=Paenibacillus sp. BSR1-1 TaxID=3020845 RepID=UPI0025B14E70|nr:DUF3231 family protein [Paenibacillus sp. BSR1-1]MDN3015526.1 DUF3231 family protein [Paenibacillus sp. BSR1-1]
MNSNHETKLTSAEIAALWTQYLNETAGLCFHKHMIEHLEDKEIIDVFEYAISLGTEHLKIIKEFFLNEGFPIPIGFTNHDMIPNTPRLFSDVLCLHFLNIMSIHSCHGYSGALTTSARHDVREYFTSCNASAIELCNRTKNILMEKGLYYRPPVVFPPEKPDFVKDDNFIAGWFGEKRPLSCIEITDIYFNLKKSIMAKAVTVAFCQVAQSKKVRAFFLDAVKTKDSHIQMFHDLLNKENLPAPPTLEAEVTKSTTSPFSEKLMMYQVGFLFSTAMVYYGTGWASSPRRDLTPHYMMAISGDVKIGNDWMDMVIENGWLEQPPLAEDRRELALKKK